MKIARYLRAKGNAPRSMLSVLSLLLLGAGGMLLPVGEAKAAQCRNLVYDISIPVTEINLAGKNNGDELFLAKSNHVAGECYKDNTNGTTNYTIVSRYPTANKTCADATGSAGFVWGEQDVIQGVCYGGGVTIGVLPLVSGTGWVSLPGPTSNPRFYLRDKSKLVGKTNIDMGKFFNPNNIYSEVDSRIPFIKETATLTGDANKTITLVYTPTCSASVNDVAFPGAPTASAIVAGTITPQTATVTVSCDDILPKYTVKVSSPNGTQGNATDGVIKSNNASVGYRLSWKEGQVASVGSNIQLDSVLTPATQPTTNTFNVPISVKPVALVPLANVTAGPANSAIKIDLTFN